MAMRGNGARQLRTALRLVVCAVLILGAVSIAGCEDKPAEKAKPAEAPKGYGMGGVEQDIAILAKTIADKPDSADLSTPESAVRSYLDWVSYSYRIADSSIATPTQTPYQIVRTDAYNQLQLQKQRLLDQRLSSVTFGKPSVKGTSATLTAQEKWSYRYVSIKEAGKTLEGPFTASYKTTYKLVKGDGGWQVDDVEVKALGEVK